MAFDTNVVKEEWSPLHHQWRSKSWEAQSQCLRGWHQTFDLSLVQLPQLPQLQTWIQTLTQAHTQHKCHSSNVSSELRHKSSVSSCSTVFMKTMRKDATYSKHKAKSLTIKLPGLLPKDFKTPGKYVSTFQILNL